MELRLSFDWYDLLEVGAWPDGLSLPLLREGPSFDGPCAGFGLSLDAPVGFGLPCGLPVWIGLPFGCRVWFGLPLGWPPGLPYGLPGWFGLPGGLPSWFGFTLGVFAVGLPIFGLPIGLLTRGLPVWFGWPLGLLLGFWLSALPLGFALAETRVQDLPIGPSST